MLPTPYGWDKNLKNPLNPHIPVSSGHRVYKFAVADRGEFLIEDVVAGLDTSISKVPVQRAAELISALADQLPDDDRRIRFKKAMIELIPK